MRRSKRLLTLALTLALLPLAACGAKTKPTLIRVDSAIYQSTRMIFETARVLGDNRVITPQQELAIQQKVLVVSQLGEASTIALSTWTSGPTPQAITQLVRALGDLSQTVVTLLENNPAARASLLEKILLAQQAILTIVALTGGAL